MIRSILNNIHVEQHTTQRLPAHCAINSLRYGAHLLAHLIFRKQQGILCHYVVNCIDCCLMPVKSIILYNSLYYLATFGYSIDKNMGLFGPVPFSRLLLSDFLYITFTFILAFTRRDDFCGCSFS